MNEKRVKLLPFITVAVLVLLTAGVTPVAAQQGRQTEELPKKDFTIVKQVWCTPVKSQGGTGTCWSWSATSLLESEGKRISGVEYELSPMFNAYYTYIEKAKRYVRMHGNNTFGEGALGHDVFNVLHDYGAAPMADYSALWDYEKGHNHGELQRVLKGYLDGVIGVQRGGPTPKWFKGYIAALDNYLGKPPEKVTVDGKEMSPSEFAAGVMGLKACEYLSFTSFTYAPFYEKVELLVPDNFSHNDNYINLPVDEFMSVLDSAVENGFTAVIGGDVSEPTFNQGKWGYGIVEADKEGRAVTQEERQEMFDNWTSTDDHAMHTVGYATDEEGKRFYYTKNSWGKESGPYEGFCYFSGNFIRAKMNNIIVHKDAVPAELMTKLREKGLVK